MIRKLSFGRGRRPLLALAAGLALSLGLVAPTLASNTVTTTVAPGIRSASTADLSLGSVNYAHVDQTETGTMVLAADDSSGTNLGWNVTIQTSNFVYSGLYAGTDIPAANFALTSAAAPTKVAGQGVTPPNGPQVPASSPVGTLDTARKVLTANAGFGKGTYTQALGVSLVVPADSVAGTYTGTLTVTITAGP
jgi:WxL domain surface cell wall-binding